jgi:hypothetical protein
MTNYQNPMTKEDPSFNAQSRPALKGFKRFPARVLIGALVIGHSLHISA